MNDQMTPVQQPGPSDAAGHWLQDETHLAWLKQQGEALLSFFDASLQTDPGFCNLDDQGNPLPTTIQELHSTTRMVHSYALGALRGHPGAEQRVDHGMAYLINHHKDHEYGGFVWGLDKGRVTDGRKLAYGHVFVLLAASSAKLAGHPDAERLITDITDVLDRHFWEDDIGLFCDEWNRDWTPFSTYRGMNANMHGVEALLAAYEATGKALYLTRARRILDFFIGKIGPSEGWRLVEHYTDSWDIDRSYAGNHMFHPAGTTPGHSFEMGRLLLQHWDLSGRKDANAPDQARHLIERGLKDAWLPEGGLAYTLNFDGSVADPSRFWWPVTEAINAMAALLILDNRTTDEHWYRKLWAFADSHFIDHQNGGWFPAIDEEGVPTNSIFNGKPDIYHALQACIFPLSGQLSRWAER